MVSLIEVANKHTCCCRLSATIVTEYESISSGKGRGVADTTVVCYSHMLLKDTLHFSQK